MTKQTEKKKATRRQHAPEFRVEALALAENVGVSQAANELGLHESQLYGWRTKDSCTTGDLMVIQERNS